MIITLVWPLKTFYSYIHLLFYVSESCASVVFVGQRNKHLVNGSDTQVPNQEIGGLVSKWKVLYCHWNNGFVLYFQISLFSPPSTVRLCPLHLGIWDIILWQSHLTLQMLQLAEYHENAIVSSKPPKRPSIKERKQKLLTFLQGIFVL